MSLHHEYFDKEICSLFHLCRQIKPTFYWLKYLSKFIVFLPYQKFENWPRVAMEEVCVREGEVGGGNNDPELSM